MATLIATTNIPKIAGRMYFCKADEHGNICVWMADKSLGRKKKEEK